MLKQLSRLEKTRNVVLLAFVIMMAVSLIFFYAPGRGSITVPSESKETLATVGNETVTVGDVASQKEAMERRFGGQSSGISTKMFVDNAIRERLVRTEVQRLGLEPSDEAVADEIRSQLKAANIPTDDVEKYKQIAIENGGSVEKFEQNFRDDLGSKKLQALVTLGVSIAEDELVENYKKQNTTYDLVYVPVTTVQLVNKMNPTEDEQKAYFEANKKNYYISQPQKKIRYLFINQSKVGEKLQIPEADLKAAYDALTPDKKVAGAKVQQIVLKIADVAQENVIRAKADNLVKQARKDGAATISEEDFANLAKGNSEDSKTASNGGHVEGLARKNPNNPNDPLAQVLPLPVGGVSEPIKFGNAYYIFRRGDDVPKVYDDATKKELEVSLRNTRAYKVAADLGKKVAEKLKATKDAEAVAKEFAGEANMKPEEMIRETGFIKEGDDVPNIGVAPQFEDGIKPLENPNDVGELTPIKDGFAVPLLIEKKDPRDAEFAEVKDQVLSAVKLDQAKSKLEQTAKDLAAEVNSADGLKAAAEKLGLKSADAKDFRIGSPLGEGGQAFTGAEVDEAILNLKNGEITKTPIKVNDNFIVIGAAKRNEINMDEFAKQRTQQFDQMLEQKKNQVFGDYLAELRRRFETEGRIKVNKAALTKLDGKAADDN